MLTEFQYKRGVSPFRDTHSKYTSHVYDSDKIDKEKYNLHCNTALLFCRGRVCRTTTQGVNIIFSGKLTRRVVKVWAPEMISTYI